MERFEGVANTLFIPLVARIYVSRQFPEYFMDRKAFAKKCGVILIEEKTFFPEALSMLGKKLNLVSKVSMKVADDKKRAIILHIRLL